MHFSCGLVNVIGNNLLCSRNVMVEILYYPSSFLDNETGEFLHANSVMADSLRFTSALSVALAVVFLVIAVGISMIKLISGGIGMPRLFPVVTDMASFLKLFTVVPVLVTAYICHYNGMQVFCTYLLELILLLLMCSSK